MSELLFVHLDGKRVYENDEFTAEQYKHLVSIKDRLLEIHSDIVTVMRQTFEVHITCTSYIHM